MSAIAERVAAGAAFLDEREPGWWQHIDLDALDLHASCRCILGQLTTDLDDVRHGGWKGVVEHFGLRRWSVYYDGGLIDGTDVAYGFNSGGYQTGQDYADLTAEWKRVIAGRRAAS